jgi:hypothetical protein
MSGPNSGWNPDGTPKADSDPATAPETPQQPTYGDAPQQASYGDAPPQQQASYGDAPQQPSYGDAPQQASYGSTGQDYSGGQPGYAAPPPPPAYPPPAYPPPDQAQYTGPTQPAYPPPPPPPDKRGQWLRLGVIIVIAVVVVGGFVLFRDRLSTSAGDLNVGDCMDDPAETTGITEVQRQPCNEPHDGEVFAVFSHTAAPGAPYPPASEFGDLIDDECVPAMEAYTARSYDEVLAAGLDISALYPAASSWSDGNREVTCYLLKLDGSKMTGSVRAGGAAPSP